MERNCAICKKRIIMYVMSLALVFCVICLGLADTQIFAGAQIYASEPAYLDVTICGEKHRFALQQENIKHSNHDMQFDFFERKLNASIAERRELLQTILEDYLASQAVAYCFPILHNEITRLTSSYARTEVNSKMFFAPNEKPMFKIQREIYGISTDSDEVFDIVAEAILSGRSEINLPIVEVKPQVLSHELALSTCLRSSFSTYYGNSSDNRKHNIRQAVSKINGTVLNSGDIFSFNKVVGKRTLENGFLDAKIIVGGEYVDGVGGGVCQVSTTLYNAVLRADMPVLEVKPHSLQSSYVEPSFDAMVNSASSDLVFMNSDAYPICVKAICDDTLIKIEFYGRKLGYKVGARSKVVGATPQPADKIIEDTGNKYNLGEYETQKILHSGRSGVISEGYIDYIDDSGVVFKSQLLRKNKYMGQPTVIVRKAKQINSFQH